MPLTILNVSYPLAAVGPDAVGGAEQVLTQLDAALVEAGHRSFVIAPEGSCTAGKLLPTPRWDTALDEHACRSAAQYHRNAIHRALSAFHVDVVHLHGIDCLQYLPPHGTPVLITLHLPPSWYPPEIFRLERPMLQLHCVSATQHRTCPRSPALQPPIGNAAPRNLFAARHAKRSFALCLGRICPEKGFHIALDAARNAGVSLLLAGKVFPYAAHESYFREQIVPRLDTSRRFIGPRGAKRKRRLLTAARCLLVPSLVAETSSLVAIESLACGTPVIAFPSGALAEIVDHGTTGFLVSNEQEMAKAIHELDQLDPQTCRTVAAARFSERRMITDYFARYADLAAKPAKPRSAVPALSI
jgi:glycosyltransferase involved in cell wall biosynthesis